MKRLFLVLLATVAVIATALADAPEKMSSATQVLLSQRAENGGRTKVRPKVPYEQLADSLPFVDKRALQSAVKRANIADIEDINGVEMISAFVRVNNGTFAALEALGAVMQSDFGNGLAAMLLPVDKIGAISDLGNVTYIEVAEVLQTVNDRQRSVTQAGDAIANSAAAQALGLSKQYTGKDVILGIIDTGIDFTHIAFKDKNGNSRIVRAYKLQSSNSTSLTTYSSASQINGLTYDTNNEDHGTHTSTTAGGSSVIVNGTNVTVTDDHANATYGGMAPEADLVLCGLSSLYTTSIGTAIQNICNYADQEGKPCVISLSLGSQTGPHDGTGTIADIVNQYAGNNHIIVYAASNDGMRTFGFDGASGGMYASGTSTSSKPMLVNVQRNFTDADGNVEMLMPTIVAYARTPNVATSLKFHVVNVNTGEIVYSSSAYSTSTTITVTGSTGLAQYFKCPSTQYTNQYGDAGKIRITRSQDASNNKYYWQIYCPIMISQSYADSDGDGVYNSNYAFCVSVYPTNGSTIVDMWESYASWFGTDLNLSSNSYNYCPGNDECSVSDNACYSKAISVGAYVTKNSITDYQGTAHDFSSEYPNIGDHASFSSWQTAGYGPLGTALPHINAPGARIVAGVNHYHTTSVDDYSYYGDDYKTDLVVNSTNYPYAAMEGTSMATPCVSGIIAQWLQACVEAGKTPTPDYIKEVMQNTWDTDQWTNGAGHGAKTFGTHGKINAIKGLQYILGTSAGPRITATPASIDFGDVTAGTTSTQTFTVTGADLEGNISLAVSGTGFSISSASVSKNTAEGNGATITVTFAPSANTTANYTGTVTLTSSNATSVTVSLTGKGVYNAPTLAANPSSLTFSGNSGSTYTKTVTVTGSNLQGNVSAAISGDANGFYSVSPTTFSGTSRQLTVTWAPTAGGTSTANLVLTTTGVGANTVTVPLSGTAQGPEISATPASVTFTGCYATRTYTKTISVTGTNLSQDITAAISGDNAFSIDQTTISRTANGVALTVTYAPTAAGTNNATVTLSSTGASTVSIPVSGTAEAATPTLMVSPSSLSFSTDLENSDSQTFAVTGRFISSDVTVALTDANGVFTLGTATIPAASIDEEMPVNVTVTFQSSTAGEYTGTVTVSSTGAESQTVSLNAEASDGGTASDAYLNIAKYATIDEAGWNTSYVNHLYKYTEYDNDEVAWLTLPTYGAWVGVYYNSHPQKWIETSLSNQNTYGGTSWNASSPLLGSSQYFTGSSGNGSARAMGYDSRTNTSIRSVSFYVTNTTAVKLYGKGRNGASTSYPASLKVYKCTKNANGSLTVSTSTTANQTSGSTSTYTLTANNLDANEIYKVEVSNYRGYMYEIGFQMPLNKPKLTVDPDALTLREAPGESVSATFRVSGKMLTNNVTVTLTDDHNVFSIPTTTISAAEAMAGKDVTVTFSSATEGSYHGRVTLTSGSLSADVDLIGNCRDGGTASDNYLNIAKYATIDEAGASVSGMDKIYAFTTYPSDDVSWLTISNHGAKQTASYQNWIDATSMSSYNNSWDATDIFLGSTSYFGSNQGYSIYGTSGQVFYVTNCSQVKALVKDGSSSKATLAIYECTENANGTLTASTTATSSVQGGASGTAVITSATLDASKIYKVQLTGGSSYPDMLEIGFCTPSVNPRLSVDQRYLEFIAEENSTLQETITVTGTHLTEDVTVTLTDEHNVYEIDRSAITIAEAEAGATVTVTLHAPALMGTYRGHLTFASEGATSIDVPLYGTVGNKGTAFSYYLDIERYSSIAVDNWYEGLFAKSYHFTEDATEGCSWLTIPGALPYYAWNYEDEDWCNVSASASGGWYGHTWNATDVFQGSEYYQVYDDDLGENIALMFGGQTSNETTNTTMYYAAYHVTNCTQAKALVYNNSGVSSTYPSFIEIHEITDNGDGTFTIASNSVDRKTSTTSGVATIASANLDASKIYCVYVGGYRGFTYEVAFRTPLESDTDLAEIVTDQKEYFHYHVTPGDLTAVYSSEDGRTLYCKDDNGYAHPDLPIAGDIDYVMDRTTLMSNDYDQSNWVALTMPDDSADEFPVELLGKRLADVKGTITDMVNPTIVLDNDVMPTVYGSSSLTLNKYIIPSFIGEEQTNENGNTYFFVTPKPMEIATVTWAMWDEENGVFTCPTSIGSVNQADLHGSIEVDFSMYAGPVPMLEDGGVYSFTALNHRPAMGEGTMSKARALSQTRTVYVLDSLTEIGKIDGDVVTGVEGLTADGDIQSVTYSNPAGQLSSEPFDGVNIVIITRTDGSRQVVKKLF